MQRSDAVQVLPIKRGREGERKRGGGGDESIQGLTIAIDRCREELSRVRQCNR